MSNTTSDPNNAQLLEHLNEVAGDLDLAPPEAPDERGTVSGRRRRRARVVDARQGTIAFVERDGVLYLEDSAPSTRPGRRRRRARAMGLGGTVVGKQPFARIEPSQVHSALEKLDRKLTPNQGMRELKDGVLVPLSRVRRSKRILLFVHGTFSNCDNFVEQLGRHQPGRDFLKEIQQTYDQVLTFDHPTVGVSPMVNARELAVQMDGTPAKVDVICHSRGGLVTRWWLEAFDESPSALRRAVFVGSPLAGTGLAAPPRLRASLSLLANVSRVLGQVSGAASSAVPFLAVATGIFRVISSITRFTAKTPLIDAAVAMIPGLAAQSRVGNNPELLSLRRSPIDPVGRYFIVKSNFEPEAVGWKFWKVFRKPKDRAIDLGADMVFEGANDLVVDTESMSNFEDAFDLPADQIQNFKTSKTVHHTNYFQQKRTVDFIGDKLLKV